MKNPYVKFSHFEISHGEISYCEISGHESMMTTFVWHNFGKLYKLGLLVILTSPIVRHTKNALNNPVEYALRAV